jgi:hypothetical protein
MKEMLTLKIRNEHRIFLEQRATDGGASLAEVIREMLDREMIRAGAMPEGS